MSSKYYEQFNTGKILDEYPRPHLVRNSYLNLNGYYEYQITDNKQMPSFDPKQRILVPFPPESELSKVKRILMPDEYLYYHRLIKIPQEFGDRTLLLHFDGIDQIADIYINDEFVLKHEGGYLPFTIELSDISESFDLKIRVRDYSDTSFYSRGKQKLQRGGIWYTPISGIWKNVWLECVPDNYITDYRVRLDHQNHTFTIDVDSKKPWSTAYIDIHNQRYLPGVAIPLDGYELWDLERPILHEFTIYMDDDIVKGYFLNRKIELKNDDQGHKRFYLNDREVFIHGLLDQGYYNEGILTPISDEMMIDDILRAKALGFNTLRKHIKIEPLRWYYHCDHLGMLVIQDMVNGGREYNPVLISSPLFLKLPLKDKLYSLFGRQDEKGRKLYYEELEGMVRLLSHYNSIIMWVPFNEGWGQFDSRKAYELIRKLDDERLIDHASGWYDQKIGEILSIHCYFKKFRIPKNRDNRAIFLSEFGGYQLPIKDHCFNDKEFGYKKYTSKEELEQGITSLYHEQIIPAIAKGLMGVIYTQLTDVEDEVNGLITYDRRVAKVRVNLFKELLKEVNGSE